MKFGSAFLVGPFLFWFVSKVEAGKLLPLQYGEYKTPGGNNI